MWGWRTDQHFGRHSAAISVLLSYLSPALGVSPYCQVMRSSNEAEPHPEFAYRTPTFHVWSISPQDRISDGEIGSSYFEKVLQKPKCSWSSDVEA